jgi:hypothetical protein
MGPLGLVGIDGGPGPRRLLFWVNTLGNGLVGTSCLLDLHRYLDAKKAGWRAFEGIGGGSFR